MTFNGCKTAVQIIWDWGWVWKSVKIDDAEVGFRLVGDDPKGRIGSVSFIDSTFANIRNAAIIMVAPKDTPGDTPTGLILDNVNLGGRILDTAGNQLLSSGYYKNVSTSVKPLAVLQNWIELLTLQSMLQVGDWSDLQRWQTNILFRPVDGVHARAEPSR